jgi:hypothetical protein
MGRVAGARLAELDGGSFPAMLVALRKERPRAQPVKLGLVAALVALLDVRLRRIEDRERFGEVVATEFGRRKGGVEIARRRRISARRLAKAEGRGVP